MNEMSNGSHPRRALHVQTGLAVALFGGFAVTLAACPGPSPHTDTNGSGGEGSTASSASSTSTTSATSSSSSGMPCTTPGECPASNGDCNTPTCDGATCGLKPVAIMTPCTDGSGKLCDGAGSCVECVTAAQCGPISASPCNAGVHTGPPPCTGGKCVDGKVEDCRMEGLVCKHDGCKPCTNTIECGPPEGACMDRQCNTVTGLCEKVNVSPWSACLPPAMGVCDATDTCVPGKYVFVTSTTFPANFGGTATADDDCKQLAGMAGLGGKWKSWTSDSKGNMGSTPLARFMPSPGPYVLVNQTVVASDWAGLTSGTLMHGIDRDENNLQVVQPIEVWTGTTPSGTFAGAACGDWAVMDSAILLGDVGILGNATGMWTQAIKPIPCSIMAHLYCFQQ